MAACGWARVADGPGAGPGIRDAAPNGRAANPRFRLCARTHAARFPDAASGPAEADVQDLGFVSDPSGKPGFGFYPYGKSGFGFRPSENPGFGFRPFRDHGFVPCPSRAVFRPQTDTRRTPVSQMDQKRTRDSAPRPQMDVDGTQSASAWCLVRGATGCADAANAPSASSVRCRRRCRDAANAPGTRCGRHCCDAVSAPGDCCRRRCRDAASAAGSRFGQHRQRGRRTRFVSWPAPVAGGAALSFRHPSSLPRVSRPRRLPRLSRPHRLPSSARRWPL